MNVNFLTLSVKCSSNFLYCIWEFGQLVEHSTNSVYLRLEIMRFYATVSGFGAIIFHLNIQIPLKTPHPGRAMLVECSPMQLRVHPRPSINSPHVFQPLQCLSVVSSATPTRVSAELNSFG